MKLYLLRPIDENDVGSLDNPWEPWYDKAFGFVVRAKDEETARKLASEKCGDEKANAWLDAKYSTCDELTSNGEAKVVIRDFASA